MCAQTRSIPAWTPTWKTASTWRPPCKDLYVCNMYRHVFNLYRHPRPVCVHHVSCIRSRACMPPVYVCTCIMHPVSSAATTLIVASPHVSSPLHGRRPVCMHRLRYTCMIPASCSMASPCAAHACACLDGEQARQDEKDVVGRL
jgi:hypothetical protein